MAPRNALFRRFSTLLSIVYTNALLHDLKLKLHGYYPGTLFLEELRAYIDLSNGALIKKHNFVSAGNLSGLTFLSRFL